MILQVKLCETQKLMYPIGNSPINLELGSISDHLPKTILSPQWSTWRKINVRVEDQWKTNLLLASFKDQCPTHISEANPSEQKEK